MMKSILVASAFLMVSVVQAEVLSWRVDIGGDNSSYVSAQLYATTETSSWWTTGTAQESQNILKYDNTYGVVTRDTTVSVGDTYSFYVRLFAADGVTMVGYSELQSWSQLLASGALVSGSVPDFPATTPWNSGTSITAVPEPTSMALMAVGVSALLLRRKRVA